MWNFPELLRDYQTLTVGVLGFAGVISTLIVNARISRNQHLLELNNDKDILRQGLITELNSLRSTYLDRSETKNTETDWMIPDRITDDFYQAMLPKLGLLSHDEIEPVMKAYHLVSEMPTRLLLISPNSLKDQPRAGYIQIKNENVDHVVEMHKVFLVEIESAISSLRTHLED